MHITYLIGAFFWDPHREAFTVPIIDRPVFWYGILFVTGFVLAYFILTPILSRYLSEIQPLSSLSTTKKTAYHLTDRMCWFAVGGTVIGARLGEVFFYSWPYFREHPLEIFMIWKGGLASHGGVLGVMLALYLYTLTIRRHIPQLTFVRLIDYVSIPTALTACFIRLGNFMNQEIVGTPTTLPWGIIFGHPAEPVSSIPRHPAQLYEAAAYLLTFIILFSMWKKNPVRKKPGTLVGMMFILIFSSRFIIEFWKTNQESPLVDPTWLQIGQLLSIPFILLGLCLIYIGRDSKCTLVDLLHHSIYSLTFYKKSDSLNKIHTDKKKQV